MPPDYEAAWAYVLGRMEKELSPQLTYHSLDHTRDDVVPAAERLASREGLGEEQSLLLKTAAFFHDVGFILQYDGHEGASVRIALKILPTFRFQPAEVDIVCKAIQATRLPQSPSNLLEEILADADLDVLGREDFFPRSKDLQRELDALGRGSDDAQWYTSQLKFLNGHTYWTASAKELRNAQKQRNIAHLERLLDQSDRKEI
jgi:uncharacterized protein